MKIKLYFKILWRVNCLSWISFVNSSIYFFYYFIRLITTSIELLLTLVVMTSYNAVEIPTIISSITTMWRTVVGVWSSFWASDNIGTSRCTKMWMNYISCWEMVVAKVLKRWITDYDNLNNKINSAYFSEHFKRLDLKH